MTKGDIIEHVGGTRRTVLAIYERECLIAGEGTDGAVRVYRSMLGSAYGWSVVGRVGIERERVADECGVWVTADGHREINAR